MTDFGNLMRITRQGKEIKVDTLSETVGVSSSYIRMLELGYRNASLTTAKKICDALGIAYVEENKYLVCGEHRFYFQAMKQGDNSFAYPYRDRENVDPFSRCTTILDWR